MPDNSGSTAFRALSDLVSPVDAKITVRKDPARPYVGLENIPSRGTRLSNCMPASSSISTNAVFQPNDVLFGKLRPNLRKCVIAPFDGYCSTDILVLRANEGIVPGFAAKVLQSERVGTAAEATAVGTKMPRTSWKHLSELEVFCPSPSEQAKIAEILDTCDAVIQKTEALIENLKAIKQGLLHDLLTRGIDANGRLRLPQAEAPHLYKESPLGWIPREWRAKRFKDLAEYSNGNTFDAEAWTSNGLPIIRIQNLNGSREFNYYAGTVNERWHVLPGDLLFAWAGQRGVSFGARFWDGPEGVLNQHIFKVKGLRNVVSQAFLHRLLRFHQPAIEDTAHGFKDSFLHVTKAELGQVVAGVPNLEEQSAIETCMAVFENTARGEEEDLGKLRALKSALMDDLLTGRVRVTPLLKSASA